MKLRPTQRALQDLANIGDHIRAENPDAAERVRASILDSLQILILFPKIGRRQSAARVRKLLTRKYRYLVYYTIDESREQVAVLAIQHPARNRTSTDA